MIFDHYLDGVRYDRRPSLWVEPLDDWSEGAVKLVELPSKWCATESHETALARCVAQIHGGVPGWPARSTAVR
jgi:glucans biosynthesis protein